MKRELLGAAAAFVITTSLATADDDRDQAPRYSDATDSEDTRSSKAPTRINKQAIAQIKIARRSLGRGETLDAVAALKRSERMLRKTQDAPAVRRVVEEIDDAISVLEADPETEPVDLDTLAEVVRKNRSKLDPAVAEHVTEAERAAEIGDNEGAAKSLQLAKELVRDAGGGQSDDTYVRVLAAQRALANKDVSRATKILDGIPAIASDRRVSEPLVPVRTKLEAAATASEAGKWDRASNLITQAREELDEIEDLAGEEPIAAEIADIDDELEKIDNQIEAGDRPSARKLRELARRTRVLGEG